MYTFILFNACLLRWFIFLSTSKTFCLENVLPSTTREQMRATPIKKTMPLNPKPWEKLVLIFIYLCNITSDVKYDLNYRSTLWYHANGKKMIYIQYPCTKFAWFTFQPSNFHLHLPISKYNINFRRRYEWILNGLRNDCR